MQTKAKALEVIEVCYLRKDADLPCVHCIYKGETCIEAHKRAYAAISITTTKEVIEHDSKTKKEHRKS